MGGSRTVQLVEAAAKLRLSYNQTLRRVLLGTLKGVRKDGHWYVDAEEVERLAGLTRRREASAEE